MSAASLRRDWPVFFALLVQAIKRKTKLSYAQSVIALAIMVEERFIK
jgi:hypothetical protein